MCQSIGIGISIQTLGIGMVSVSIQTYSKSPSGCEKARPLKYNDPPSI